MTLSLTLSLAAPRAGAGVATPDVPVTGTATYPAEPTEAPI